MPVFLEFDANKKWFFKNVFLFPENRWITGCLQHMHTQRENNKIVQKQSTKSFRSGSAEFRERRKAAVIWSHIIIYGHMTASRRLSQRDPTKTRQLRCWEQECKPSGWGSLWVGGLPWQQVTPVVWRFEYVSRSSKTERKVIETWSFSLTEKVKVSLKDREEQRQGLKDEIKYVVGKTYLTCVTCRPADGYIRPQSP